MTYTIRCPRSFRSPRGETLYDNEGSFDTLDEARAEYAKKFDQYQHWLGVIVADHDPDVLEDARDVGEWACQEITRLRGIAGPS